jgi:hypothetical protein
MLAFSVPTPDRRPPPIASVVGADAAGMVARVAVTVGFTSLAGALLCLAAAV